MAETIIALASGHGPAGVGVIRVSGPAALSLATSLSGQPLKTLRHATLRPLYLPETNRLLDKALLIGFAGPNSFTGEDILEIHVHGGRAVIDTVMEAAMLSPGVRLAQPGEFTRRAFENGKLDLTEAEAINDLIHAQTVAQQDLALRQLDGDLKNLYEGWRGRLMTLLSYLEAEIEFPDEDLPADLNATLKGPLETLLTEVKDHLADGRAGQIIRDGYRIALVGLPNAGKSSLMNALAKRDVAIVSDIAGTTRDSIEISLTLAGYQIRLFDLAGLRDSDDTIEQEGVRRAQARAADSDHCLVLVPLGETVPPALQPYLEKGTLVRTKADLFHVEHEGDGAGDGEGDDLAVSAVTGAGMADLITHLTDQISAEMQHREGPVLTRARHRQAMEEVATHLERAIQMIGVDEVLTAEDLRLATRALGSITGRVSIEDRLDIIFRDFCIGK